MAVGNVGHGRVQRGPRRGAVQEAGVSNGSVRGQSGKVVFTF